MKIHERKKATRLTWKKKAKGGKINNPSGDWVPRTGQGSMIRDFYPQRG